MYSKEYFKNLEIVRNKLDSRALLEALAEEAAELSQAALKLIRAKGLSGNPTLISDEEAEAELLVEIADFCKLFDFSEQLEVIRWTRN